MEIESNEAIRKALLMLEFIAQGEADVQRGQVRSHAEVVCYMEKKLNGYRR